MDLVVAACRALANRSRLHLLRALQQHPGTTVKGLAKIVGLVPDFASQQLKLLVNYHFVQAVPRGRRVLYHPAKPLYVSNQFLRETLALVHQTMGKPILTPGETWDSESQKKADADMIKVFTTYTHLRRLLVLRYLAIKGPSSPVDLMTQVGMSRAAVHRHLTKLQRRGVLINVDSKSHLWRMATKPSAMMQRKMLGIVLRALRAA